ncbi:MAG TPA: IclR family transcriptional regulator [Solirubrobacteraceae bacterium]|nr:IclR family transcriptional regulator [Solirubrobacteraceae bacterium]
MATRERARTHTQDGPGPSVADRMFTVLDVCAARSGPLTLVDLGQLTGLPKTTLHRVCWKLVELRVLEHSDRGFQMSARLYALGAMSPGLRRLRATAMPLMHTLVSRTGWMANLGVLYEHTALVVDEVAGSVQLPPKERMLGTTMPLYATALGKALAANAAEALIDKLCEPALLRPFTGNTIVRTAILRPHLEEVRRRGYAISREELRLGTCGVAAPVIVDGELAAAIALVGPPDEAALRRLTLPVKLTAQRLAEALGSAAPGGALPASVGGGA